jgi:hypothetical protein
MDTYFGESKDCCEAVIDGVGAGYVSSLSYGISVNTSNVTYASSNNLFPRVLASESGLVSLSNNFTTTTSSLISDIDATNTRIDETDADLLSLSTDLTNVTSSLNTRIDETDADVTNVIASLATTTGNVTNLASSLTATNTRIDETQDDLFALAGAFDATATNVSNVSFIANAANTTSQWASNASSNYVPKSGGTISGNLVVSGNLEVSGTTTSINTSELKVDDNRITLNANQTGVPSSVLKSGVEIERGSESNYFFVFEESSQLFKVGKENRLQAVATRPDNLESGFVWFDDNMASLTKRDITTSDVQGLSDTIDRTVWNSNISQNLITLASATAIQTSNLTNRVGSLETYQTQSSNGIITLSTRIVSLSNDVTSTKSSVVSLSNNIVTLSNQLNSFTPLDSSAAIYGSNVSQTAFARASEARDVAWWTSNQLPSYLLQTSYVSPSNAAAIYGSNTSVWTSNQLPSYLLQTSYVAPSNNDAVFGSNVSRWTSNQLPSYLPLLSYVAPSNNDAVFGSNVARWTSNQLPSYLLQTAYVAPSNAAAIFGSNTGAWASNQIPNLTTNLSTADIRGIWTSNQLPNYATTTALNSVQTSANSAQTTADSAQAKAIAASNQAYTNPGGGGGGGTTIVGGCNDPWWSTSQDTVILEGATINDSQNIIRDTRRSRFGAQLADNTSNLWLYAPSNNPSASVQIRNPGLDQVLLDARADGAVTIRNLVLTGTASNTIQNIQTATLTSQSNGIVFRDIPRRFMLFIDMFASGTHLIARFSSNNGATYMTDNYTAGATHQPAGANTWTSVSSSSVIRLSVFTGSCTFGNMTFHMNTRASPNTALYHGDLVTMQGTMSGVNRAFVQGGRSYNSSFPINCVFIGSEDNQASCQGTISLFAL